MTLSSFRDACRGLIIAASIAAAGAPLVAQQAGVPATTARLTLESVFDRVTDGALNRADAGGVGRVRAEASHQRASRRSTARWWGTVITDQSVGGAAARTLAGSAAFDATRTMSRRTRLDMSAQLSSAPLDLFAAFGAADAMSSRDVGTASELDGVRTLSEQMHVTLMRTVAPRAELKISAIQSGSRTNRDSVMSTGASIGLTRRVGQFGGWRLGYGATGDRIERAGFSTMQQRHDIDVGLDYARPLPFWPRTSVSMATGSTVLSDRTHTYVRLNTNLTMSQQVARRWSLRTEYTRPIQFVAGLNEPLLSDAIRTTVLGTTSSRLDVAVAMGVARGTLGAGGSGFESYAGSIRASRRIGPEWVMELEYHDAHYRFDRGAGTRVGGIPGDFSRRGVRAGLVWAPRFGG